MRKNLKSTPRTDFFFFCTPNFVFNVGNSMKREEKFRQHSINIKNYTAHPP